MIKMKFILYIQYHKNEAGAQIPSDATPRGLFLSGMFLQTRKREKIIDNSN